MSLRQQNDFPWYPQIDGCQECGATDPDACTCDEEQESA